MYAHQNPANRRTRLAGLFTISEVINQQHRYWCDQRIAGSLSDLGVVWPRRFRLLHDVPRRRVCRFSLLLLRKGSFDTKNVARAPCH